MADSFTSLGLVLQSNGELDRAQSCFEQALAIRQQILGEKHLLTGRSLKNLATVLEVQGAMARARSYYRKALTIFENQLGLNHADTILVRDHLTALEI
jgi:tetratricopeptide (TPR) repeat protein